MGEKQTIPVIVGVTGHRDIRRQDEPIIRDAVRSELKKLQALCPHSPLMMLNSLAEGSDLLCADVAEELGIPLIAVLPREQTDYERDFSEEAKKRFTHHCIRAEKVFVAPPVEALREGDIVRDYRFRQAGIYVATHCHVLLALWDGEPGQFGCGTAEMVDVVLNGSYDPVSGIALRSGSNEAVIQIFTPRKEKAGKTAGSVQVFGDRNAVLDILQKTDDFNRNAASVTVKSASRLPLGAERDPLTEKLERISIAAGMLSRQAARRYRRVLALLAVISAILTFAFLLYDEAQMIGLILVCGMMLFAAWGCLRYAARSDCHRRYIEYRVLAECLRVQTCLRYAGSAIQTADLLPWTQQEETTWVLVALCTMTIGDIPEETHEIRTCWVDAQREYHRKASESAGQKLTASERVVNIALVLSIMLYLAAVGYELLCGGVLLEPRVPVADAEFWRTILKILLGTISAVTLFVANYFGRLSLSRTFSDHQKMERFYGKMSAQLEKNGQTEELLTVLAREELVENGNWCSYQRDNKPDFSF